MTKYTRTEDLLIIQLVELCLLKMAAETPPRNESRDFKLNRITWSSSTVQNYLPSCNTQTTETVDYSQAMPMWQEEHAVMSGNWHKHLWAVASKKIYRRSLAAVWNNSSWTNSSALHCPLTNTASSRTHSSCIKPKSSTEEHWWLMSQRCRNPIYSSYEEAENRLDREMGRMWSRILREIDSYPILSLPSLPSMQSSAAATAIANGYIQINRI